MTKEQKGSHSVKETNNDQGKAISKYKSGTERQKGILVIEDAKRHI